MTNPNVILYSYRRPELTHLAILEILKWPKLERLMVSIDGLRADASKQEEAWRSETIRIAESHAEKDSRVEPSVWEINEGLTEHAIRIMTKSFESSPGLIALEEDNQIGDEGLDFLRASIIGNLKPVISTAFTTQSHFASDLDARYTHFPEQWTTSLSFPVFESFVKNWNDKKISRRVIKDALGPVFGKKKFFLELVSEKWFRMFKASTLDPSYGDALMAYSAMSLGIAYRVPMNSLVVDIGYKDDRGLHPRTDAEFALAHKLFNTTVAGANFCITCEYSTSGIRGSGVTQSLAFLARSASNLILRGGALQQK